MINQVYVNGLYTRIDWLEFTVDNIISDLTTYDNVCFYLDKIGLHVDLFEVQDKGGLGYRSSMRRMYENIFVYYDGTDEMGIHVRVSGSSVNYVLERLLESFRVKTPFGGGYDLSGGDISDSDSLLQQRMDEDLQESDYGTSDMLPLLIKRILMFGHFTRIDLAIDDIGTNYYSVQDVVDLVDKCQIITKFRNWENVKGFSFKNEYRGHTFYMGSRQSDVYLRVYEKGLESHVDIDWVRWELEVKHDKADVLARQLVDGQNIGKVAIGLLSAYVRFIVIDNKLRKRCSLHPTWQRFIDDVSKLCLTVEKKEKTIDDKLQWIEKQCMPTIAGLIVANGGDISFLRNGLEGHFDRLSGKDKLLFLKAVKGGDSDDNT